MEKTGQEPADGYAKDDPAALGPQPKLEDSLKNVGMIRSYAANVTNELEENTKVYNDVSKYYQEINNLTGFNDHFMLGKYVNDRPDVYPKNARIVDIGVGPGLVGEELLAHGYSNFWGVDYSQGMLDMCKTKMKTDGSPLYQGLYQNNVGNTPLPDAILTVVKEQPFDILTSSATHIKGHLPNIWYYKALELLKTGGDFMFTLKEAYSKPETDEGTGYMAQLNKMEHEEKLIKQIDKVPYTKFKGLKSLDLEKQHLYDEEKAFVMVYRKL